MAGRPNERVTGTMCCEQVRWRPVLWGLGLQFILGLLILRWEPGYHFFRYLGEKVRVFLEFADEGSVFVFGEKGLEDHTMAFKVRPPSSYTHLTS